MPLIFKTLSTRDSYGNDMKRLRLDMLLSPFTKPLPRHLQALVLTLKAYHGQVAKTSTEISKTNKVATISLIIWIKLTVTIANY